MQMHAFICNCIAMQISGALPLSVEVAWPALPGGASASPARQESYRFPTELTADTSAALDLQSLGSGMYTFTLSPSN